MEKKLTLSPEHLRVESFWAEREMMQAPLVTTRPYTCPECANSSPFATCA